MWSLYFCPQNIIPIIKHASNKGQYYVTGTAFIFILKVWAIVIALWIFYFANWGIRIQSHSHHCAQKLFHVSTVFHLHMHFKCLHFRVLKIISTICHFESRNLQLKRNPLVHPCSVLLCLSTSYVLEFFSNLLVKSVFCAYCMFNVKKLCFNVYVKKINCAAIFFFNLMTQCP